MSCTACKCNRRCLDAFTRASQFCNGGKDKPLTNYDSIRAMTFDELENTLLMEICELTGKSERDDDGISKRAPLDCPHDCQICMHDWLKAEAKEGGT